MNMVLMGAAVGNRLRAEGAEAGLELASAAAFRAADEIRRLSAELARVRLSLALEKSHSAGLSAQVDTCRARLKGSELWKASGRSYKSGNAKPNVRIAYEQAYDATARSLGIARPEEHRA